MASLRIGILGAASVASYALVAPAREVSDVVVQAIAARDPARARAFAKRHKIPVAHTSYAALIADPEIDAVYNPLPNGLHGRWTVAALQAGKHVLCEKPFAANAEEAEAVASVARASGRVCMEAFHYRYHALIRRVLAIIASGELGTVRHIDANFCIILPVLSGIRWDLGLAGGALMDTGCYAVHLLRTLAGAEPTVRSARAKLFRPGIDRWLRAEVDFADGCTGTITTALLSSAFYRLGSRVLGTDATLDIINPIAPQYYNKLIIQSAHAKRVEKIAPKPTSYAAQLQAFADAVLRGASFPTTPDDAIATMRVIDACYAAAGLARREPTVITARRGI